MFEISGVYQRMRMEVESTGILCNLSGEDYEQGRICRKFLQQERNLAELHF
jgi:hypothetical protein